MYFVCNILDLFLNLLFFAQACKSMSQYQSKHYSAFIQSEYKANFTFSKLKYGIFVITVNKILMANCEGDDIINSLICIFISTVQEKFCWNLRKLKMSYLRYFYIRFTSNCHCYVWIFYSFYWINLNLYRISPLTTSLYGCYAYKSVIGFDCLGSRAFWLLSTAFAVHTLILAFFNGWPLIRSQVRYFYHEPMLAWHFESDSRQSTWCLGKKARTQTVGGRRGRTNVPMYMHKGLRTLYDIGPTLPPTTDVN